MACSVRRLRAKEEIYDFLKRDRLYAAYAICDLEPALFRQCDWYATSVGGELATLCLLFRGLPPDRVFLMGSEEGLAPILHRVLWNGTRNALALRRTAVQVMDVRKTRSSRQVEPICERSDEQRWWIVIALRSPFVG